MRPVPSWLSRLLVALCFTAVAFLYYYHLADSPMYIAHDEAMFGVVAHQIAWHARDVDGNFLPLLMPMSGVYWNMPAHVYLTAAFVRAFGTTETVIRASSATASLVAVLLLYVACRRMFRHRGYAVFAAILCALAPSFFIDSRQSTDHHYPVLAIALWLVCLARFVESPEHDAWLAAAGLSLGAGIYTYGASVLLMPLYVIATLLLLAKLRVRGVRPYLLLVAAFVVAAVPFALFVRQHPNYIGDVANMYKIYDARRFNVLQGAHELVNWTSLGARADVYFSYFNPSTLFVTGSPTRLSGFFLPSFFVLLPAAVIYVLKHDVDWFAWLALVAFFATPLAAAVVDERGALQRVMALAPFGAILVAYFVMRAAADPRLWVRVTTWILVASLPLWFARFYADYLTDYPRRSSFFFELNVRGALETAIQESRTARQNIDICLSRGINPLVDWYWKFYLRKHGMESLESRTLYFDTPGEARNKCAPGVIVVSEIATCDQIAVTRARAPEKILEPGGSASFCVF